MSALRGWLLRRLLPEETVELLQDVNDELSDYPYTEELERELGALIDVIEGN